MMTIGHNWLNTAMTCVRHTMTAAATLMALALVSCTEDEIVPSDTENQEVTVTFTMSLSETTQGTRANDGWDDYNPTDPNSDAENSVDVNDLQILVCDNDGKKIAEVENVIAYPVDTYSSTSENTTKAKTYNVYGSWEPKDGELDKAKKIMVFANCSQNSQKPSFENLSATSLSFERKTDTPLPMWGVVSLGNNGLEVGKQNTLSDIWLLRATAKVDVRFDSSKDMSDYKLKSVKLYNYNTKGHVLPNTWNKVDGTQSIKFNGSLNAFASAPTGEDQSLTFEYTDDTQVKTKVLYIPEYDNTPESGDTHCYIELTLADKQGNEVGTYKLDFCNYDNDGAPTAGSYYDIQRNHYYQFSVYKEANKLKIKVRKWNEKTNSLIQM